MSKYETVQIRVDLALIKRWRALHPETKGLKPTAVVDVMLRYAVRMVEEEKAAELQR